MGHYFKLVCLREKTDWLLKEYKSGRIRFGWSWPGSDLKEIGKKSFEEMSDDEKITWRYTQFLINRVEPSDRVVLQFERPLRRFLIAEIIGPYQYAEIEEDDFNHILPCRPVTPEYIDIESSIVSRSLRHDLSKRGHYYEIYPEDSIKELDALISEEKWNSPEYKEKWTEQIELARTRDNLIENTIQTISKKWKGKDFEIFASKLLKSIDGIEVKAWSDSGKGWDLQIRIFDPISNEILYDDVPVQCKNYEGLVETEKPIEDLERCVRNSDSNLFYLLIIGNLTDNYLKKIYEKQESLMNKFNREITFKVICQDRIAELYISADF